MVNSLIPSRSNRSSGGSKSDNHEIGYNRGAQGGYNTGATSGYNHGYQSKSYYQKSSYQKSNYQKSSYQKLNYQKSSYHSDRSKKAQVRNKPRAASSRIDSPPEEILLIGDSMLRNIDPDGYKQAVWLFSYPGINASQLHDHILHEWLPCESRIRSVILHVGTNNASTLRDNIPVRQCAEEVFDVMELLNSIYPQAEIWFSGILPRLDDDHKRGLGINEKVKAMCQGTDSKYKFIDLSDSFIKDGRYIDKTLFRYSEGHRDDCVHLGDNGNILLQDMVGGLVNHLSNIDHRFDLAHLMNQTEWDNWREEEFGKFENIKRFRVTNWVPSVQRGSTGSSNEVKSKVSRRSNNSINHQPKKRKYDSAKSGYNTGQYNQGAQNNVSNKSGSKSWVGDDNENVFFEDVYNDFDSRDQSADEGDEGEGFSWVHTCDDPREETVTFRTRDDDEEEFTVEDSF